MAKKKFQILKQTVSAAGETVTFSGTVLEHLDKVVGVAVSYSDATAKPNSTLELDIDNHEIFPDEFEADLIAPKSGISANALFWRIAESGKGSVIKGKYTDGSAEAGFEAYDVRLILLCYDA